MHRLGVDVGALFMKAVRLDSEGRIALRVYERHRGRPREALEQVLAQVRAGPGDTIGFTGSAGAPLAEALGAPYRDVTLCQIEALRTRVPEARYIMDVGGGSATLIHLDEGGRFQGFATNSLCAAGTGSFLDEQAARLGISFADARLFRPCENPPAIAARCTVFAKSDLIHRQQEGWSRDDMWSGLCRGMTRTLLGTLLNGRPLDGPTALIGGVALNREVVRWLEEACAGWIVVPPDPESIAACGAAAYGTSPARWAPPPVEPGVAAFARFPWPLTLEKSAYPSFATEESWSDEAGNEIRIARWPRGGAVRAWLGVDIGSTSTKAVLADEAGDVVADVYRKTAGDPIGATQKLLRAIQDVAAGRESRLEILGVGTTGSGRRIVGAVLGADAVVNEITAHVAAAARVDPTIDTIFEIGGQDAKYMHVVDGNVRDANMNYVCAAGTGSFVEEMAGKLGYPVSQAGGEVMGIRPPHATDRCTVFMEQDMNQLMQAGATPKEAFAAVMVAVVKNYLIKVVGNRHRSRTRIFFQGATARNPALVAAFEKVLDVEIVVSPFCHVMGAWGVALLTRQLLADGPATRFRGLDLDRRAVTLRKSTCDLCHNACTLTHATIEGVDEEPSWGYLCGREPDDRRVKVNPYDRLLKKRQRLWLEAGRGVEVPANAPVIGIPRALSFYTYLPLWRRFFNRLGFQVKLTGPTSPAIRDLGSRMSPAEFCFPAKVFIGHAAWLAVHEGVDFLFLPQMKNEEPNEHVTTASFCPYVQATPATTRAAFRLNGLDTVRILRPVVDLRLSRSRLVEQLAAALAKPLSVNWLRIRLAWSEAFRVQREFEQRVRDLGIEAVEEARRSGEKVLVLVGRPYNLYDTGINLGLPSRLAEHGRRVIPLDAMTADLSKLGARYQNTFWGYGQRILATLEDVAADPMLDAAYLTNFSCGPDSFLLSFAGEIMGGKPHLTLELDEHGSDTGYLTRIEAFFDVLRQPHLEFVRRPEFHEPTADLHDRTVWVPNMHPFTTELVAAALRSNGYDARALPPETRASFERGRSVTRGSECLPMALTIGSLLGELRAAPAGSKHAFFMPSGQGPCRFGQYVALHRQILDREGHSDVPIMCPTHFKGFAGLDEPVRRALWKGMVAGDLLMKAGCRVRPYERESGATDRVLEHGCRRIARVLERRGDVEGAVRSVVAEVAAVPVRQESRRPIVGIVGEIYVRNNLFANEEVVRTVERIGAEAWIAPLAEWILFATSVRNVFEHHDQKLSPELLGAFMKWHWMAHWERRLYAAASPLLDKRHEPPLEEVLREAGVWLPESVGGEALLTVGRAVAFARQGAVAVVNVSPFGCMPGTVAAALFREIALETQVPVVNMFYDGTGGQNRRLEVHLRTALSAGTPRAAQPTSSGETSFPDLPLAMPSRTLW